MFVLRTLWYSSWTTELKRVSQVEQSQWRCLTMCASRCTGVGKLRSHTAQVTSSSSEHRVRTPSHLAVYPALTPVAVLLPEGGGVVDAEVVVRHHAVPAAGARPRPAAAAALATRHLRGGGPRPLLLLGRVGVWRAGPDYGRAVCVLPAPALLGYKLRLGLGQFLVRIFCQQSAT